MAEEIGCGNDKVKSKIGQGNELRSGFKSCKKSIVVGGWVVGRKNSFKDCLLQ